MTAIEATNRGVADAAWAMLTSTPEVPVIEIADVERRSPETLLLDVREPEEYAHGHVPGAVNLPQAELASRLDEVPQRPPGADDLPERVSLAAERAVPRADGIRQRRERQGRDGGVAGARQLRWRPDDTSIGAPRVIESEWAHAGGAYVI